jgi:predicted transcriptional regulator
MSDLWIDALQHGDTKMQAHASMAAHIPRLQKLCLYALRTYRTDGLSCQELEGVTGLEHSTASARLGELRDSGLIYDTGRRRRTKAGRSAIVWRIME